MPLNGSDVASKPAGTAAVSGQTIESAKYNSTIDDVYSILNTVRTIAKGFTGASTAVGAHDNLSTTSGNIASASTTDLATATGWIVNITGTTTITALGTVQSGATRALIFADVLTLTHNATSLILPGAANITTAAGDVALMVSKGSGNWKCAAYQRADGTPVSLANSALRARPRVRAATTANITISTALNNGDSLDGVTLATGDLVLVKDQSSAEENGVYVVGSSPSRSSEYAAYNDHPGQLITVAEGTVNADTIWLCTSNAGGTIGSTALAFAKQAKALSFAMQAFTANGTYTPTSGMTHCLVIATGSGGGGGGADSDGGTDTSGGGGGAGGTAIGVFSAATIGASKAVTIGAAGTAGAAAGGGGGGGGDTTFGALLTGGGGNGGSGSGSAPGSDTIGLGGVGGTASGGTMNIDGGSGAVGYADVAASGGVGGASFWGGGGRAGATFSGLSAGSAGQAYGSGGGGAADVDNTTGAAGGAGKAGVVFVLELVAT